jgi:uridylate kinase
VDGVYDTDPNLDPDAKRFTNLTYREALDTGVKVMDESAFVLANEHGLVMHVFDVAAKGAMSAICQGEDIGTRITGDDPA